MAVVVLCFATGSAAGEEQTGLRLEAKAAFDEAQRLNNEGKYADAIARGERSLAIREQVLGGTHPEVADSLNLLGILDRRQGDLARARSRIERALAIREASFGKFHPDVASSLNALGSVCARQGSYDEAVALSERALTIQEATLGKNHPDVAATLTLLGNRYADQGLYSRAESVLQRALEIREETSGKDAVAVAQTLHGLASLYRLQGAFSKAGPLFLRALAIREATLGMNHPEVADSADSLASFYRTQAMYGHAEALYRRALAIREAALGKNHPVVAQSLHNLALVNVDQGWFRRAEPLFQRAIEIQETASTNRVHLAQFLNNFAVLYIQEGAYSRAEPLVQRALAIRQETLRKNHPEIADSLNTLASLYINQGSYDRAEPLLQHALATLEAGLGENHPDIAYLLYNIASTYFDRGQYERAEPFLVRSLSIRELTHGKNHPDVADSLDALAQLYIAQGSYRRAEALLQRALAIEEPALGKNHPDLGYTLNLLADLYLAQGLHARAAPHIERAVALREANLEESNPHLAASLNNLAQLRLAQGRLQEALPLFSRAFVLSERRLRQEALGFSESRMGSFLQLLRATEARHYALLRAHPDDIGVRRLALSSALLLKGRSVEETADTSRTIYRNLGAEDRDAFDRLRGLRTQLAQLSLDKRAKLASADHRKRVDELARQADALEADLAKRSAPLRALTALPSPTEIVDGVAAALPKNEALVELVAYEDRPLAPKPGTPKTRMRSQLRYLALVLFPDASIRTVDLGPASRIDGAAFRLRNALAHRDAAFQSSAQALYELAFRPLLPILGKTRRVFLSPDGQLGLVPFAALHDGRRFLIDSFDFTYLTSGKDLLSRPRERPASRSVVVLADPDLGAAVPLASAGSPLNASAVAEQSPSVERFFSLTRAELADLPWVPLPGTRQEAEVIQQLLPHARVFLGADATKERLLHLPTPGVLHLATHGFFLEDAAAPAGSRAVAHFGALGEASVSQRPPDPLLRSGLVLAGALAPAPEDSGGSKPRLNGALVTALELAGLDLWGTELVVLSACDTGRGDVKLGQGVYGMRRAFVVAGAETVVMSLWKVNDDTTRVLMEAYYRNLLAGQGRASALGQAMRSLRQTRPHPHAWAPFIALGRDAPLTTLAAPEEQPKP